jgi:hypothetical protein
VNSARWHELAGWGLVGGICLYPLAWEMAAGRGISQTSLIGLSFGLVPICLYFIRSRIAAAVVSLVGVCGMAFSSLWDPFDAGVLTALLLWLLGRKGPSEKGLSFLPFGRKEVEPLRRSIAAWAQSGRLAIRLLCGGLMGGILWELSLLWPSADLDLTPAAALVALGLGLGYMGCWVLVALLVRAVMRPRFPSLLE